MSKALLTGLLVGATHLALTATGAAAELQLHPSQVTGSSYLANDGNAFDENYLPIYAVDGDRRTAWVEGQPDLGQGAFVDWMGLPGMDKPYKATLRLYNGYQKSPASFQNNARLKDVRLQSLNAEGKLIGHSQQARLADRQGFTEIELMVPAGGHGFRLTIDSVHPGKRFSDACLGDIEVYVDDAHFNEHTPVHRWSATNFATIQRFVEAQRRLATAYSDPGRHYEIARYYGATEVALPPVKQVVEGGVAELLKRTAAVPGLPLSKALRKKIRSHVVDVRGYEWGSQGPSWKDGLPRSWRFLGGHGDRVLPAQLRWSAASLFSENHHASSSAALRFVDRSRLKSFERGYDRWLAVHRRWRRFAGSWQSYSVSKDNFQEIYELVAARGWRGDPDAIAVCLADGVCTNSKSAQARAFADFGAERFASGLFAFGPEQSIEVLLAVQVESVGAGTGGAVGDVERAEYVFYNEQGLAAAIWTSSRVYDDGGLRSRHGQLLLLDWRSNGNRLMLAEIWELRSDRLQRPDDRGQVEVRRHTAGQRPTGDERGGWTSWPEP